MQYKRLKKRHIVYIVILVVWLAACITGYINVNRRFPQPAEDFYSKGDTVEYEGMEITAEELSYMDAAGFKSRYQTVSQDNWIRNDDKYKDRRWYVAKFNMKNVSDSKKVVELDILPNLQLTGYPVGYSNQGQAITVNSDEDTVIMPGEEKEIVIYFTVANSPSRPVNQKKLIKSDFYIDLSVYPDHKAIVFHGVDDSCDIDD